MNSDQQSRDLLTCALLHLDPRIVNKRMVLNSLLIEIGLFSLKTSCTTEDIKSEVDNIVGQKNFFLDKDFDDAIEDCKKTGAVYLDAAGRFELSNETKNSLEGAFDSANKNVEQVKLGLIERIELEADEPLDNDLTEDIFQAIRKLLTKHVYEASLQLARQTLTWHKPNWALL